MASRWKYTSLTEFLRGATDDEVRLTFSEVEGILGKTLPQSAYKTPAWWANSRTRDGHGLAHEWLAAGWASSELNLRDRSVTFRRAFAVGDGSVSSIAALYPKRLEHLLDLLVEAKLDVSGWAFTGDGDDVEHPRPIPTTATTGRLELRMKASFFAYGATCLMKALAQFPIERISGSLRASSSELPATVALSKQSVVELSNNPGVPGRSMTCWTSLSERRVQYE